MQELQCQGSRRVLSSFSNGANTVTSCVASGGAPSEGLLQSLLQAFPGGDAKLDPQLALGKCFVFPTKCRSHSMLGFLLVVVFCTGSEQRFVLGRRTTNELPSFQAARVKQSTSMLQLQNCTYAKCLKRAKGKKSTSSPVNEMAAAKYYGCDVTLNEHNYIPEPYIIIRNLSIQINHLDVCM